MAADLEVAPLAHVHRHPHDRIVLRLAVHLGQHRVGLGRREEARALDRRQLRGIAEHQKRTFERQQVAAHLGVDHRAFVDHDQLRLRGRRVVPQFEARLLDAALARAIDQRVDGGGAVAALVAHHQRRLAGEGRELHAAVDAVGDVPRQRGLAGAGIAEQAEHRRRAVLAGLGLEPIGHGFQRRILVRREGGHEVSGNATQGRDVRETKARRNRSSRCVIPPPRALRAVGRVPNEARRVGGTRERGANETPPPVSSFAIAHDEPPSPRFAGEG